MQFQVGLSFPWSVSKWAPDTPYLNIISSATHDYVPLCTFLTDVEALNCFIAN